MLWLVLGMTIAVVLAAFVVAVVAIPARRTGRYVLTERGETVFRVADERARAARTLAHRRRQREEAEAAEAEAPAQAAAQEHGAGDAPTEQASTGRFGRLRKRRTRGATAARPDED